MKTRDLLILLLLLQWQVLAKEYTSKEGARKADVKVSLNDKFVIAAFNGEKFYVVYSMSNSPIKPFFKINYHKDDAYVYSLCALKRKSNEIVSFLQVAKNNESDSVSVSRIDINLSEFNLNGSYRYHKIIDKELSDITQGHILIKVDAKQTYAYVFAESFILSYSLLTKKIYQYKNLSRLQCDTDYGSFIPHAVELKDKWAAMIGIHRIPKGSRQKSCLYIFKLESFSLLQARTLEKNYVSNSEHSGYNQESIMSLSINPSGTIIAIGQGHLDTVTFAFMQSNKTHANISEIFQLTEDVKSIDFGRSVTWLDDKGTLAILVGRSSNRTGLQSEIQVFANISSNPSSVTMLPKFALPNNQQPLHKVPYNFGWRRRSYLVILSNSKNLLILRDDGKLLHIPSADSGFSSMESMESPEIQPALFNCPGDLPCAPPPVASFRKGLLANKPTSMVYYFLPKPCITGSYKNTVGFGPCTVCPSGTKNPGRNKSSDCLPCKPAEFCSLGASNEVNLTSFNSTIQVFSYPDSPIIDNYDDVLLLNFIPNTWTTGCVLSSPLFITILFIILSFIIWFIMLLIKKRQPTSLDVHRNKAKRILKRTDLIGEGERLVGGLASLFIFAILIYSIVFAVYYFFSYTSDDSWVREACKDTLRNTKYDNALQLPLPDPQGNQWKIFDLLNEQNFTMNVILINTGAGCDHIDVYHNKHRIHPDKIIKNYCNDTNNDFTTTFSFDIPTHISTVQIAVNGPYFIGALRLCLYGEPEYINDADEYRELKKLDVCTLFHTEKQTIGVSTYFSVDLVRVINVTKPLKRGQQTNYSGIWKPIITSDDELSEGSYYSKYGEYLRYASDQTIFTVKFVEENYYVQNNKSPIIRRAAMTFHTFMFVFLLIDTIAMLFIIYKLWGQPLLRFLLHGCHKSYENEHQLNPTQMPINASSKLEGENSVSPSNNQDIQQQQMMEYSKFSHSKFDGQSSISRSVPSTKQDSSSNPMVTNRLNEDSDKRLDIHDNKIECLSNEVLVLKNQNDELNKQIIYLKQCLNNTM